MNDLLQNFTLSPEFLFLFGINLVLILLVLLLTLTTRRKIRKLKEKYNRFMNGFSGENVEQLLESCIDRVNQVSTKNRELESQINALERNLIRCVQKVGIVRYNAFENVGSDLSFAIALLDNHDDGVVISGIYARESSSTYAKPIQAGKSRYPLSAEEMQAIDLAKKTLMEKLYTEK